MQQQVVFELFDVNEWDKCFHLRSDVQPHLLTNREQFIALANLEELNRSYLERIEKKPEGFIAYLKILQADFIKDHGVTPSKTKICSDAVLHLSVSPLQKRALVCYELGKIPEFIAYCDYFSGIIEIPAAIGGAVDPGENGQEKAAALGVKKLIEEDKTYTQEKAEEDYHSTLKEYQENAKVLEKDPSGFLLIKQVVDRLKKRAWDGEIEHPRFLPYQYPILVAAGAIAGQEMYEKLYNLWG